MSLNGEAYCKAWTGLDWTGFVKHGFVKGGFVKHGFVKGGFVKHVYHCICSTLLLNIPLLSLKVNYSISFIEDFHFYQ